MDDTFVKDIERYQLLIDLKATRALLEQGWCQYAFHTILSHPMLAFKDQYCIRGAMNNIVTGVPYIPANKVQWYDNFQLNRLDNMSDILKNLIPPSYEGLASFNDEKGRTQQDVLNLFDKAIEVVKAC